MKDKILDSIKQNAFWDFVDKEFLPNTQNQTLLDILIELHNSNRINLIEEFKKLENQDYKFFLRIILIESTLAKLDATITGVKEIVKILTKRAGNDIKANVLFNPFIEFCAAKEQRVKDLLTAEINSPDENFNFISMALEAGFKINQNVYLTKALELINHDNNKVQSSALISLYYVDFSKNKDLARQTIRRLFELSQNTRNNDILSNIFRTILSLTSKFKLNYNIVTDFLKFHKNRTDNIFLEQIAYSLSYEKNIPETIQKTMFRFFDKLDPNNIAAIENIDWYLYNQVDTPIFVEQIEFLLDNRPSINWLNNFKHTKNQLQHTKFRDFLSRVITRWLLKREYAYCLACNECIPTISTHHLTIPFDTSQVQDNDIIYLIEKSIGWFYIKPTTAISLALSLSPLCNQKQTKQIEDLIFQLLYISYPGITRDYLDTLDQKKHPIAKRLIKKHTKYINALKPLYTVKEMRPSLRQRSMHNSYQRKLFADQSNKNKKEYIHTSLFPTKTILYGKQSILNMRFNGMKQRTVTPLQVHAFQVELPKLEILTPHTLQYKLNILKFKELQE